jgi:hypothetical protein
LPKVNFAGLGHWLKDEQTAQACAIAFHEKAGCSQVGSSLIPIPQQGFFSAELPLLPPFHPHSWLSLLLARCKLGVLISAGAATC